MGYIKIEVQSAGLLLTEGSDGTLFDKHSFIKDENGNDNLLTLLPSSRVRGFFSYLLGNTERVSAIQDSGVDELVKAARYKIVRRPYLNFCYLRRSLGDKGTVPSVKLDQFSKEDADPTVALLWPVLCELTGSSDLIGINRYFCAKSEKISSAGISYNSIPVGSKLEKQIREYISNHDEVPQSVVNFINQLDKFCREQVDFSVAIQESKYGKFSIITSPSQTKQWIQANQAPRVVGTPAVIMNFDFDIYLSSLSNSVANRLVNGPGITKWGEGGIAIVYNHLDVFGVSEISDCSSDFYLKRDWLRKELCKLGYKIKKFPWESNKN